MKNKMHLKHHDLAESLFWLMVPEGKDFIMVGGIAQAAGMVAGAGRQELTLTAHTKWRE